MNNESIPSSCTSTPSGMQEVFEAAARYFSVLGEPTRLRILHAICQEERCVNEIIKTTGLAQANVSRHLGLMYQAGLLSRRREGTQIFYRVADPMYVELCRTVTQQVISRMDELSRARCAQQGLPQDFSLPFPSVYPKENASV
jgi:DNA-binding transcriptional ArsR family regulator